MGMNTETDDARQPFLEKPTDSPDQTDTDTPSPHQRHQNSFCRTQRRARGGLNAKHALFHIVLVGLYTILSALTIYALRHDPSSSGPPRYTAPAWLPDAKLSPSPTIFYSENTRLTGSYVNATVAHAWSSLLQPINMRTTDDELVLSGVRESVRLPSSDGGDDNLVWLNVFDELRCLKSLQEFVGLSASSTVLLKQDLEMAVKENYRCIETLRQSVMCMPDLTLNGLEWDGSDSKLVPSTRTRVRECVDWDVMVSSLEKRTVSEEELAGLAR